MLAFDQFYLMTGGAPRGQTFTSVYWIYQNSFVYFKLGYGSALSIILMLVIMCGTALQLTLQRRGERGMTDVAALPELARRRRRPRREPVGGSRAARYLVAAVCVFLIAIMLLPLVMSFLASIKTPEEASAVPPHLPAARASASRTTGRSAHYQAGLWTYVSNSLIVAFLTIAFCLVARGPGRLRRWRASASRSRRCSSC